jgi:anti-sigma regulatory factor (Ser/Thr protein kinase)
LLPYPVGLGSRFIGVAVLRLLVVEQAAGDAPTSTARVAAWAGDAFTRLGGRPGVRRVGLALVEGGGRRLRFTASDRDGSASLPWCHVDAYDDVPLNAAVRSGQAVIGTIDDLEQRFPQFVELQRGTATVALAAVPLVAGELVLGGFVLFYDSQPVLGVRHHRELARLGRALGTRLRTAQRSRKRPSAAPASATQAEAPAGAVVAVHQVAGHPEAVGEARQFLRATLHGWGVDASVVDTAVLCLSELVTNAVIHSLEGCLVRVVLHEGVVRVAVRDAGVSRPARVASPADPLQVHGRGLQLVEALASRWGHDIDPEGLSAWFEVEA